MVMAPKITTGMPAGKKPRPRSDFSPTEFDQSITTKGYRMWWSRAGICPCQNNDQTDQPDPNCQLCKGEGRYFFLPDNVSDGGKDVYGNEVELNDAGNAVSIYVLMTAMAQDVQLFERFGEWVFGTAKVTTQAPNKLGYHDRFIARDAEMVYAQIVEFDGADVIPIVGSRKKTGLRYPYISIHELRSVSQVYKQDEHYTLTSSGTIAWIGSQAPDSGTRLAVHGTVRPVWIVLDHVNTYRDTQLAGGTPELSSQKAEALPVHAVAKLDFLLDAG